MRVGGLRAIASRVERLEVRRASGLRTEEIVRILQAGRMRAATGPANESMDTMAALEAGRRVRARLANLSGS